MKGWFSWQQNRHNDAGVLLSILALMRGNNVHHWDWDVLMFPDAYSGDTRLTLRLWNCIFYFIWGWSWTKHYLLKNRSKSSGKFMRNIPIQVCFMKLEIVISAKNIYKECISGLQFPWQFVNIININYKISLKCYSVYLMYYPTRCSIRKWHYGIVVKGWVYLPCYNPQRFEMVSGIFSLFYIDAHWDRKK